MMTKAIAYLNSKGIASFEHAGVLVIPVSAPTDIDTTVRNVKRYLKEVGYDKSWMVSPYFYERHPDSIIEKENDIYD